MRVDIKSGLVDVSDKAGQGREGQGRAGQGRAGQGKRKRWQRWGGKK